MDSVSLFGKIKVSLDDLECKILNLKDDVRQI